MDMAYVQSLVITHTCHCVNMQTGECLKGLIWKVGERFDKGSTIGMQQYGRPVDFGCHKCVVAES